MSYIKVHVGLPFRLATLGALSLGLGACGDPVDDRGDSFGDEVGETGGLGEDTGEDSEGEEGSSGESSTEGSEDTTTTGMDPDEELPPCEELPAPGFPGEADPSCQTEPAVGMFEPIVEWHKDSWAEAAGSNRSASTPIVVQLTDDNLDGLINDEDMPDIVTVTHGGGANRLRAVSGDGQTEILSVSAPGINRNMSVSGADIDGDGITELLTVNNTKQVLCFEHDGTLKWTSAGLGGNVSSYDNTVSISDMDSDGTPELVVGRAILDNEGQLIAAGSHGVGTSYAPNGYTSMSFAVDITGDGIEEVVVGNALYDLDGNAIWHNGESDGFPGVADLDGDFAPEIVVVSNGVIRLQEGSDGSVIWSTNIPGGLGGPPTIADFDGDGMAEIGVAGNNKYSVYEGDGTVLWSATTQDNSSGVTGSSVYDFEGDGINEVVYGDETNLWVFNGVDGSVKLQFEPHNSGTRLEYPTIADVDDDGQVEIVLVSEPHAGGSYAGITVIGDASESWRPGRKLWNQHAYFITNINDDGTVPVQADKNWLSYNNFRSGDLSAGDGLSAPKLALMATQECANSCIGNEIFQLWMHLGNLGSGTLTAGATIEVYGTDGEGVESLLTTFPFEEDLVAGMWSAAFPVEVPIAGIESLRATIVSNEPQCDEAEGAELILEAPFCFSAE